MPNRTDGSPYRMSRPPVARNVCNFVLYSNLSACEPEPSGHAKMIPLDADVNKIKRDLRVMRITRVFVLAVIIFCVYWHSSPETLGSNQDESYRID